MICDRCGQRVGVVNGKVAEHQAGGGGRCSGSGMDVDD